MTSRRAFIQQTSLAGMALYTRARRNSPAGKRVGIIGLDTSHSIEFTKLLNSAAIESYSGYKVVCAYPCGSTAIPGNSERIKANTEAIQQYGVAIVPSIEQLLAGTDVILLETNDGHTHTEQFGQLLKAGKPVFIDKPVAASLTDVVNIFNLARAGNIPVYSSSALRYGANVQAAAMGKFGKILGAAVHSPAPLEPSHPDFFWYGIHGIEMLFTVMGTGCNTVRRVYTEHTDVVIGIWEDGRIGVYTGTRQGKFDYGGIVFCEKEIYTLDGFSGYGPLLKSITQFFETGEAPVSPGQTIEIYAFMEAADESKRQDGAAVTLKSVLQNTN
ncbi:MAG TPA: Gfo/Idh/MocA family oxidoreductase [Chitinophagaceae bacterium]|nr:Gfo/Idh/MocA family oxidoreductase [Chitinophagaceae bacterium]